MMSPKAKPSKSMYAVDRYAEADLPTVYGPMRVIIYRAVDPTDGELDEHVALVIGDAFANRDDVLVRVHSECITSEVFGSLKCDCRDQLSTAIEKMRDQNGGVIVYLRQEGRGIGLGNKIRAYALQAQGVDTVDANHQVGFESDLRTYDVAGAILKELDVRGVSLMTNNPRKVEGLEKAGIRVVERIPLQIPPSMHSARYLATKRDRLGHLLDLISPVISD